MVYTFDKVYEFELLLSIAYCILKFVDQLAVSAVLYNNILYILLILVNLWQMV